MNKYLILLLVTLFISCDSSEYPEFSKKSSSLYYQRVALGEGFTYNPDSCFLDYSISVSSLSEELLFDKKEIKFAQISNSILKDSILNKCQAGDHFRFISSERSRYLYELCKIDQELDSTFYLIDLNIDQVYNLYIQEEDHNVLEYREIERFLTYNPSKVKYEYFEGIWIKQLESENSSQKAKGEIVLDYKGYSLKGDEWDIPDFPLKFNTKDQYQVIKGIELALTKMNFNDRFDVIIPSYLAFGEEGSKNGNIPPFKALRYLLKVQYPDSIN